MNKKIKLAGALIPALLFGSPAMASSRVGSRSSTKGFKSLSVQKESLHVEELQKEQTISHQDPFGVFGTIPATEMEMVKENSVMAFLAENGLLSSDTVHQSSISGNTIESRKHFSACTHSPGLYTTKTVCTSNGHTWNAGDTDAPTFENSTPSQNSITDTQVVINVDINEGGKAYAVVVTDGAAAPTAANVKAGQANGGGAAIASGNVTLSSGAFSGTITLTGLSSSTAYDIYVVAQDDEASPNVQNAVTKVEVTTTAPPADSDATLTAAGGVSEPVPLDTTVDTTGEAVDLFDFTISDGGTSDGLTTDITQIVLNVSGTATDAQRAKVTWRLNGNDVSNVTGTYDAGADTITFSGLSISIADGGSEVYTVNGYYNDNTGLTEDLTFILSTDGDTDFTVDGAKTQMAATSAVNNSTGTTVDVVTTALSFSTQPATSTSGSALGTQPVVKAVDAFGNVDTDFTETITLSEASAGALSGDVDISAVSGVATFTDVTYTSTADQQSFTLTANDEDGTGSNIPTTDANAVTSDVVATKLVFDTQPAPTTINSAEATALTTVPVVSAKDANDVVDTGYATDITLAEVNGAGSATMTVTGDTDGIGATVTITPSSGVATFTSMNVTYTASGGASENFNLQASSGGLTTANSSQMTGSVDSTAPTISAITIPNSAMKIGDTVTATITVTSDTDDYTTGSGAISGTIGGFALGTLSKTNDTTYTATFTVTDGGTDVASGSDIPVSVKLTDSAGNQTGTAFTTAISQASDSIDANKPTLSTVTIASSNTDTTKAKAGDVVTLTFSSSEALSANPVVTIATNAASVTNTSGNNYTATYTMQSGDSEGAVPFTIDFSDSATNAGTQVTAVTSGSGVTFDKTLPSGYSVNFTTDPVNSSNKSAAAFVFASAELGTIYNYSIDDTNLSTPAVTGNGTIATSTDTINSIDLSGLDDDTLTLTVTLTDPSGNTGTNATDTVLKDVVAPSLTETTAVLTTTTDSTPEVVLNTDETGTITLSNCGTSTSKTIGSTGDFTLTLTGTDDSTPLIDSTYNNCQITITDAAGNTDQVTLTEFKVDTTAPTTTFNPLNTANHPKNNDLTITFDEAVRNTDDSEITSLNVDLLITLKQTNSSGSDVAFDATIDLNKEVITINPTTDLTESQVYYLAYGDVEDLAGNTRSGENITFTAQPDTTAPTISTQLPQDNNTTTIVDSNLTVTFDETIRFGTGNIVLKYDTNDSTVASYDVTSPGSNLSINGAALTIDPTNNLNFNTKYYIMIDNGAIKDNASAPNSYDPTMVKGDWDFTTFDKVSLNSIEVAALAYTEGDDTAVVSSTIAISNPSDANITEANISISSNFVSSEDILEFSDTANITGDYNSTTGVMLLSGEDTVANYQTALREVKYKNTNEVDPDTNTRTISFSVSDSVAASISPTRDISITAVDNTPDAVTFTSLTNQSKNARVESNTVDITGIENGIDISIINGEYEINQSGTWTDVNRTINNDDNVTVRVTTSDSYSTAAIATLTIGSEEFTFSAATSGAPSSGGGGGGYVPPVIEPEPEPEEPVVKPEPEEPAVEPEPEEPAVEPEPIPEPEIIIDINGNFDEDPTDNDIDVIVIDENDGTEKTETINEKDTGKSTNIVENIDNEDITKKEFIIEQTDTVSGEKNEQTIIINNPDAVSTVTETGFNIEAKKEDELSQVSTKLEINTNGTSVSTVISIDNETGESKSSAVTSFIPLAPQVQEDGSVSILNKDTTAIVKADGTTEHTVGIIDEETNTLLTTKATSKVDNTVVSILDNGTVQTKVKQTTDSGDEIVSVVDGRSDGQAIHLLKVTDSNGVEIVTKATSDILGAQTTIEEDGSIATKVTSKENVELAVEVNPKGQATHKISVTKEDGTLVVSKATSNIKGAATTITEKGNIETSASPFQYAMEGKSIEAVVDTLSNGEAYTRFEITDIATGKIETKNTLNNTSSFEEGNSATIKEEDGKFILEIETKVTKILEF
ncbi:MAG: Ig-like domain-containing protein [Campylobacterota bacterium]|nr:Ig-like domain-containing protein [Campylobacterota bacterium]